MEHAATEISIDELLRPENNLEIALLKDRELKNGLFWGTPRFGHPEGQIIYHIREVLDNVEALNVDRQTREQLRLITMVHDSFKYMEDKISYPRDWSKHHGKYARKFFEKYSDDDHLLELVELHDEAFYCWRLSELKNDPKSARHRMNSLITRLNGDMQMFYLFFKCDTMTGDKNQAPLKWFESSVNVKMVELVRT